MVEELEQKAIEWVKEHTIDGLSNDIPHIVLPPRPEQSYIAGYNEATKELQKETELLSKHIIELQADKGKLIDENRQAKEIIKTLCDGYSSTDISENEMIKRIAKAEAFLKEIE